MTLTAASLSQSRLPDFTMQVRSPSVDDLILTIHSATLSTDRWGQIIDDICHSLSAEAAALVRPARDAREKPWCHLFGRDNSFLNDYLNKWAQHDCWYEGAVRSRRIGVGLVNIDSQLIDRHEFQQSKFANEFLRRLNIDRMMNVCLVERIDLRQICTAHRRALGRLYY